MYVPKSYFGQGPQDLANVSYTQEFADYKKEDDWLLECPIAGEGEKEMGDGYVLHAIRRTEPSPEEGKYPQSISECRLTDPAGNTVLTYHVYGMCAFAPCIIHHADGMRYFIFQQRMYGYSIFQIETGKVAHYIPRESFSPLGPKLGETFILYEVHYCPVNNILVGDGCYWAAPYWVEIYDFSDPLSHPLPIYCDGFSLRDRFNFDLGEDISPQGFTPSGDCILQGRSQDNNPLNLQIDIVKTFA